MTYREEAHREPIPGTELPAFIVAEYDGGDKLLYSHGAFDIWCVYHAVPVEGCPNHRNNSYESYPLELTSIFVEEVTGTQTDLHGRFSSPFAIEYDGSVVTYDFDAPEDIHYLQDVRDLAATYGQDRVWEDFLILYDCIPQQRGVGITRAMTQTVLDIAVKYPNEQSLRLTLDCLLCAMIAENNRLRKYGSRYDTKLGKKVKALGVYQAIYETNLTIRQVADYSKGKHWKWISEECRRRGIQTPDFT